jgi:hypothetical protein
MDTLHGLTLFFIFAVITATAYSLKLVKKNKADKVHRFDMTMAGILIIFYVLAMVYIQGG